MSEKSQIIQFNDFTKLDIRTAKVVEAYDHPNADKLIVLKIDLGSEQRQLIAGLRGYYEPDELVGKQIVVLTNLPPRNMRGMESRGMLLAGVTDDQSSVVLLTLDKELPPGSKVS